MANIIDVREARARQAKEHFDASRLDDRVQQALRQIETDSVAMLQELCRKMFDGIDDSFFELANQAHSNIEQNRYFDAMREIRLKRRKVESEFTDSTTLAFQIKSILSPPDRSSESQEEDSGFESLSLVNHDELEEDVAVNTMHTKAAINSRGPLLLARHRFGHVFSVKPDALTLPIDPKIVAENFAASAQLFDIEIKERLILLKQFDRFVLVKMGELIERVNQIFVSAGILEELKPSQLTYTGERSSTTISNEDQHSRSQSPSPSPSQDDELGEQLLPNLRSLLSDIRSRGSNTRMTQQGNPSANTVAIGTDELVRLLDNISIQQSFDGAGKLVDIKSLLDTTLQQSRDDKNISVQLDQVNDDVINLVSMLFEFILDDYNLAPPIQVLISRLQIPILKVVIKDNRFFSDPKNPARRLLNTLAKAGIGWSTDGTKADQGLYEQIHDTVQEIIEKQNDDDHSHFETLLEHFEAYIAREERRSKIVEQRTREVEEGRLRAEFAKKTVHHTIRKTLTTRQHLVPSNVATLIEDGWSRVMFIAHVKDKTEHQWPKSVQVLEDLVWCFEPINNHADKQRWIKIVPKLVKDIDRGLSSISYKPDQLESIITELKSSLMTFFKRDPLDTAKRAQKMARTVPANEPETLSAVEKQVDAENKRIKLMISEVKGFEVGDWFEIIDDRGSKKRCRLVSKVDEMSRYIFVNRTGLKVFETDEIDLARKLSVQRIKPLQSGLLFDRAMHSITKNLRAEVAA